MRPLIQTLRPSSRGKGTGVLPCGCSTWSIDHPRAAQSACHCANASSRATPCSICTATAAGRELPYRRRARSRNRSTRYSQIGAAPICEYLVERFRDLARRRYGSSRPAAVAVQIEQGVARLEAFAQWQADWAARGWSIDQVEQPQGNTPVPFPLDDGRSVWIKGRIDRIDRHADGSWALFDYKTGDN